MRIIRINPFARSVTREFVEVEIAFVNYYTQSREPMVFELGQEHLMWVDNQWAIREKQAFWTMKGMGGVLGGYGVITGKDEGGGPSNCSAPLDAVAAQFDWVSPEMAALHPVVQKLRSQIKGFVPMDVVSIAAGTAH